MAMNVQTTTTAPAPAGEKREWIASREHKINKQFDLHSRFQVVSQHSNHFCIPFFPAFFLSFFQWVWIFFCLYFKMRNNFFSSLVRIHSLGALALDVYELLNRYESKYQIVCFIVQCVCVCGGWINVIKHHVSFIVHLVVFGCCFVVVWCYSKIDWEYERKEWHRQTNNSVWAEYVRACDAKES